jgi:hypothetical protein
LGRNFAAAILGCNFGPQFWAAILKRDSYTMKSTLLLRTGCCLACLAALVRCLPAAEPVSFRSDVAPILLDNCLACHGPKKAEGGYRVDTFEEFARAGDSGEQPLQAGEPPQGEVLRRIVSSDHSERMPADSEPLTAHEIDVITRWIAAGASFDGENPGEPLGLAIPPRTYADPPESYKQAVPATALAFSPDGSQLLVAGYHEITVWNCEDGGLARRIKNMPQRIFAIRFLADGQTLAVGGGEPGRIGEVRLVDFASGAVKSVIARTSDVVFDVAQRPGSPELAVAAADSLIRIIHTETLEPVRTIASHADWVTALAWSDDGAKLVSASRDKSAKVYDAATGDLQTNYQGHAAAVRGVAFTADGKQVLSTGGDNKLHRWNVEGGGKAAEVATGGDAFQLVRFDNVLLVPSADKHLRQIDLSNNSVTRALAGHHSWVTATAASPDRTRFASGTLSGEIQLWNAADGAALRTWIAKP